MMTLSGVRSSWETFARSSVFRRSAARSSTSWSCVRKSDSIVRRTGLDAVAPQRLACGAGAAGDVEQDRRAGIVLAHDVDQPGIVGDDQVDRLDAEMRENLGARRREEHALPVADERGRDRVARRPVDAGDEHGARRGRRGHEAHGRAGRAGDAGRHAVVLVGSGHDSRCGGGVHNLGRPPFTGEPRRLATRARCVRHGGCLGGTPVCRARHTGVAHDLDNPHGDRYGIRLPAARGRCRGVEQSGSSRGS